MKTRKDAVEAAKYCSEKYLSGKAKIVFKINEVRNE